MNRIGCFCHIPKTAGLTVELLLKRHFGMRHPGGLAVTPRRGLGYDAADMRAALSLRPNVASLSGHGLRPFVDYAEMDDRLVWYTILRDPIRRCISNYQHQVEGSRRSPDRDSSFGSDIDPIDTPILELSFHATVAMSQKLCTHLVDARESGASRGNQTTSISMVARVMI
ncbi:MAG: sulfotransferase family protein [Gemmatimonadota bacterium]|nr:sulfotransferase family protein [Gemmatimonadota bacterium]